MAGPGPTDEVKTDGKSGDAASLGGKVNVFMRGGLGKMEKL